MGKQVGILNIGFGHLVFLHKVVAILNPASAPLKRLKEEARAHNKLVDATNGRKTRAMLLIDNGHIVLSALQAETLAQRIPLHVSSEEAHHNAH